MNSAPFNLETAGIFRKCAEVLRRQAANPFRVSAYVRAAQTLESLQEDARDILRDDGVQGLIELSGIGRGLAASIDEIARTGRLAQLDRLRGETAPENLFRTVPGIGPKLAHAIHDELHVDTLEALEVAHSSYRPWEMAFHGVVLQHRQGARTRADGRLGCRVFLRR